LNSRSFKRCGATARRSLLALALTIAQTFVVVSLCLGIAPGQMLIDTIAGGKLRSGVPAQEVVLGSMAGIAKDSAGNIVFCEDHLIRRIRVDGTIETVAGTGVSGYGGDGGPASESFLFVPQNPRFDSNGNLFFIDRDNLRIRRIDKSGVVSTVAGTGIEGSLGSDGPATAAQIEFPNDLAVDKSGNVYFTESFKNSIRRVTPAGKIETYAGSPHVDFTSDGDGGPAVAAHINQPSALAFDGFGNLYAAEPSRIRRISPDGTITQFAGYGASSPGSGDGGPAIGATFGRIFWLAADSVGNVYVSERFTVSERPGTIANRWRIRRISPDGAINTVAGTSTGGSTGDGPALQSQFSFALGLFADESGNVFFVDGARLRVVTKQGEVKTIAGGSPALAPDGKPARESWLMSPFAMALGRDGTLYISEPSNCTIRRVNSDGLLSTLAGTGKCSTVAPSGPAASTDMPAVSSLAVDSQNRVYAADGSVGPIGAFFSGTSNIFVISPNGAIAPVQGSPFPAGPPGRLAIDSKDRLYVLTGFETGTSVLRVSPGSAPDIFLRAPPPGPINFAAIAIDSSDNVYLMDARNNELFRLGQDGKDAGIQGMFNAFSIAADALGNIWEAGPFGIAETSSATPRAINAGASFGFSGDGGPFASALFASPSGLAFAPNGDLYILDQGNRRIRKTSGSPPKNTPSIGQSGIVNALSLRGGAIAPGELVSIFGSNLGPVALQTYTLNNNSVPPVLGNVAVYFNQIPGRITAASAGQINVFVPSGVGDSPPVEVIVDIDGARSSPVTVAVAESAFGLASADSSGEGPGAILNQDGSYNNKANPAAPGSIVTLFGTGAGLTTPRLTDGALEISLPFSAPVAAVSVTIGGQAAELLYAGAAPLLPTGVLQINARIPTSAPPGDVPIAVTIGNVTTSRQITCAVM
jgi:uncharacterized protein (TIGR03437 family)